MKSLHWILYFILGWDSTFQTKHQVLNIGIIYDSTTNAWLFNDTIELLLQRNIGANNLRSVRITWGTVKSKSHLDSTNKGYEVLNSGIHVLISALRCPQLTSVSAMTEALRIPHLALDLDTCSSYRNETYTMHFVNQFHYLPGLVTEIVIRDGWKTLILSTDDYNEGSHMSRFVKEFSKAGIETVLRDISLITVDEWTEPSNFLVKTNNLTLLDRLLNNTKSNHLHKWIIITDLDISQEDPTNNFVLVRSKYKTILSDWASFTDSLTYTEHQLIDVVKAIADFAGHVCFDQNNTLPESCFKEGTSFWDRPFGLQELISQACRADQIRTSIMMCNTVEYEIYGLSVDALGGKKLLGVWLPNHDLIINQYRTSLFRDNSIDFGGIELKVAVHRDSPPLTSLTADNRGYEGLCIDILDDMSKMLNFKYILVEPKDNLFGHQLENGSWTGMIGMIQRREVDMAAGPISITLERFSVVEYVTPFMQDGFGILAPRSARKADMFQVFKPLSLDVWLLVVMCGVLVSLGLILVQHLLGTDPRCPDLKENWIQESVFLVVSSAFEQGLSWQPTRGSSRCLLGVWFVFTILAMSIYTANLAALLTVLSPVQPINNLEDLAARPDLGVVIEYGAAISALLKETRHPVLQEIAKRANPIPINTSVIDRVAQGELVYLDDVIFLRFEEARTCGAARIGDESFQGQSLAFAVPKNSPYKNGFDISVQKIVESGTAKRLEQRWIQPTENATSCLVEEPFHSLDVNRLVGVFIVFGAFVLTAMFSLLLEKIVIKHLIRHGKKTID